MPNINIRWRIFHLLGYCNRKVETADFLNSGQKLKYKPNTDTLRLSHIIQVCQNMRYLANTWDN